MASSARSGLAALSGYHLLFWPVYLLLFGSVAGTSAIAQPVTVPNVDPSTPLEDVQDNPDARPDMRPFSIRAGAGLNSIYNSNPLGVKQERSDFAIQGQADLSVHDQTERFQGDLSYSLTGNYHFDLPDLNAFEHYLNAVGRAELVPEHLFANARAFAWPTYISRLGSLDAGGAATANSRNAYGYIVTPDFAWRFGDIAQSNLMVTQSGQYFSNLGSASQGVVLPLAGPQNAASTTISERLKGGAYFGRLEWILTVSGTNSAQKNFRQSQRMGEADFEYHLDHSYGIVANVGYRKFSSQPALTRGISGVIAMGGFSFRPNDTFSLVVKAGKQYDFTSFTGNLLYQFTAASALVVTVDDIVTTPQDRLLLGLDGLGAGSDGFVLPGTTLPNPISIPGPTANNGQPVSVVPLDGLALDNIISRYRTATAKLIYQMARTTVSLTAYGTVRDYLLPLPGFDLRQTIYGGEIRATRNLRRDLTASVRADYSVAHEFGGIDKLTSGSAILTYNLSENWSGQLHADYINRDARTPIAPANGTVSDLQIGLGMHYNF